jgi:hypothetical protein
MNFVFQTSYETKETLYVPRSKYCFHENFVILRRYNFWCLVILRKNGDSTFLSKLGAASQTEQFASRDLCTPLLRTAVHCVGTVSDPTTSKTSWEQGSKLLMDQPASYTKTIPQLILIREKRREGDATNPICRVCGAQMKPTASRNHSLCLCSFQGYVHSCQ